jgi:hypothetical protein
MRFLWMGLLLASRDLWPRLLFVDTCPPVATYKANTGQTKPFRKMRTRFLDEFYVGCYISVVDERGAVVFKVPL